MSPLKVPCPTCRADPGVRCNADYTHLARAEAANAAERATYTRPPGIDRVYDALDAEHRAAEIRRLETK